MVHFVNEHNTNPNEKEVTRLTEEEYEQLQLLYRDAQNTPVIALSTADALAGRDLSSLAWTAVKDYMDHLGKKYNFDPAKHAIKPHGIVIPYERSVGKGKSSIDPHVDNH